jgi:glycerol-3-phosphate acyltransferase PlsY
VIGVPILAPLFWVASYLAGSIPAGLIVSLLFHGADIRKQGSGNIGTAKVYRVYGRGAAALTLLFDALKGFAPVFIARWLGLPLWALLVTGILAILGHNWSIFLRGRGGKGIATSIGVLAGLTPLVTLIAVAVWAIVIVGSRYASLASLLMMISVPILLAALGYGPVYLIFGVALVMLAVYRHRANIDRLRAGTEVKIKAGRQTRAG